jgi:hypothetical protein
MTPRVTIMLVALAGCPGETPTPIQNTNGHMSTQPDAVVAPHNANEWTVSVTRAQGQRSATGTIVIVTAPTKAVPAPHAEVAAAEAWLMLARGAFDARGFADAGAAAHEGIAALGEDYRPKLVKDDTFIRMSMGDESIHQGKLEEGATSLIAVLDSRIYMYFVKYKDVARRPEP